MEKEINIDNLQIKNDDMQIDTAIAMLTIKAFETKDVESRLKFLRLINEISENKYYSIVGTYKESHQTVLQIYDMLFSQINRTIEVLKIEVEQNDKLFKKHKETNNKQRYNSASLEKMKNNLLKTSAPLQNMINNNLFESGLLNKEYISKTKIILKNVEKELNKAECLIKNIQHYNANIETTISHKE